MKGIPQIKYFNSFDGTKIASYVIGKKEPAMILSNGLGGNIIAWKFLTDFFKRHFRIYSWDYRGLYRSEYREGTELSVEAHVRDLKTMLDLEGIKDAIFLGWSMGVQVNFEFYRMYPEHVRALVQINGTYGSPLKTAFNSAFFRTAAPYMLDLMEFIFPKIRFIGPLVTKTRGLLNVTQFAGLTAPTLDEGVFLELARDWVQLNFVAYSRIFKKLGDHDAEDVLKTIKIPTLIVAGEKDLFTPVSLSRKMQQMIPDSELFIVRSSTHYCPVEFPELINLRIEKFLKDHRLI
jgi:pimeloyl-ACP methyl ester carboxylesterase